MGILEVRNVGKRLGGLKALSDVNLSVREDSCHAIIGPNGAGKSTLRTIARLDDPALRAGQIWLDGKPMHEIRAQQASAHGIQLVPEDRRIIPGLTVEENLQLAQIAPFEGWDIEVLLLDEPYQGPAPVIVQEIARVRAIIREQGIITILVGQNAGAALRLADRVVILDTGPVVYDGTAIEVSDDAALRAEYPAI